MHIYIYIYKKGEGKEKRMKETIGSDEKGTNARRPLDIRGCPLVR